MQRRAAAVSAVVLLVIAAGAYAFIGAAAAPTVDIPADHSLSTGQSVTLNGTQYTVSSIGPESGSVQAKLSWSEQNVRKTNAFDNASNVTYQGDTYTVVIPNASSPSQFTLREVRNVSAILQNDARVENEPVTRADGRKYVVYSANGSTRLLSEYLPARERITLTTGDSFPYQNQTTEIAEITPSQFTVEWFVTEQQSTTLSEGGNVTNTAYFAHFPDNSTLQLSTAREEYRNDHLRIERFHDRMNGLWGISELAALFAILLLALAYLPSRY